MARRGVKTLKEQEEEGLYVQQSLHGAYKVEAKKG